MSQVGSIPDRRHLLPAHGTLKDLQRLMEWESSFKFDRFKLIVRDAMAQFDLDDKLPHTRQNTDKWNSLVQKVVENEGALNAFVDHWPIKAYFDSYTNYKAKHDAQKRKTKSTVPENVIVKPSRKIMYIGIPPPRVRRSATNSSSNKRQDQQGPSQLRIRSHSVIEIFDSPPPRIQPAFESAFDNDVRQPCLVCTECPDPLVSSRLRALFRYDPDSRQKLGIKLGLRCDLDLDTLLLLDQATRDKLFRESNMSDDLVARIKAILHSEEPKSHVNSGISENDLRRYISSVYPCKEHPVLSPSMKIPPHFLRTFNSVHMEHLLPLALLPFQSIGDGASFSPLQKAAILWALSTE